MVSLRKDKGKLREKDELTVSVSGEARECELCCRESVVRVRERESVGSVAMRAKN